MEEVTRSSPLKEVPLLLLLPLLPWGEEQVGTGGGALPLDQAHL